MAEDGVGINLEEDELNASTDNGEMDLDALEREMEETEQESRKLKQIQSEIENQMNLSTTSVTSAPGGIPIMSPEEKAELDSRSVYVGNVDYGCTAEELEKHFHGCGSVSRVTILCDKFTGHPKGFAYVEFTDVEGMKNALAMDESLLRGRQIKVNAKRTNKPGISTTNRPPRFRGMRGMRGGMRGMMYNPYAGFRPRGRGLRRRPNFHPYAI